MTEPVEGQPCPVCGLPDPDHDWDVHDAQPAPQTARRELLRAAGLPDMLRRSSTRGGAAVRVLALHTTEGIMRAADLRAWAGWPGSSHAAADAGGALLGPDHGFVPYHLAAWTLRSGNPWSENLEMCALASWARQQWLDRPALLEGAARWLADRHKARGIPLTKITPQQYRAGQWGVIAHHDHTVGYTDGTHWDVGQNFPWDVVIPRARQIADDGGGFLMGLSEDQQAEVHRWLGELRTQLYTGPQGKGWPSFRYDAGEKVAMTPIDYLRTVDRELQTRFPRRAVASTNPDTLVGHVLNQDARIGDLDRKMGQVLTALQQVLTALQQPRP